MPRVISDSDSQSRLESQNYSGGAIRTTSSSGSTEQTKYRGKIEKDKMQSQTRVRKLVEIEDDASSSRVLPETLENPRNSPVAECSVDPQLKKNKYRPKTVDVSSLSFGKIYRGDSASSFSKVKKNSTVLSEMTLHDYCSVFDIDCEIFDPFIPERNHTVLDPPDGYEAIYDIYFKTGFRLPVLDAVNQILNFFELRLPQIAPNGWRLIMAYLIYLRKANVRFSIETFASLFSCSVADEDWYSFKKKKGTADLVTGIPNYVKNWKDRFFYIKKVGLPKRNVWRSGKIKISIPLTAEAKLLQEMKSPVDFRMVDAKVVKEADLEHITGETNLLIQERLDEPEGTMSARRDEMLKKVQLSKEKQKGQKRKYSDVDRTEIAPGPLEKAKGNCIKESAGPTLPSSSLQEEFRDLAAIDPGCGFIMLMTQAGMFPTVSREKQIAKTIESANAEVPFITEESDAEKETDSSGLVHRRKSKSDPSPTSAERNAPTASANVRMTTRSLSKKGTSLGPSLRPAFTRDQWLGDEPLPDRQYPAISLLPEPPASATQPLLPETLEQTIHIPGAESCRNFEVAKRLNENSVLPADLKVISSLSDNDYERSFHCNAAWFRGVYMDGFHRYKEAKAAYIQEKENRIKYAKMNKEKNAENTNLKAQVKELELEKERLETDAAIADNKATTERRRAEDLAEELKMQKALFESVEIALKKAEEEKKSYAALEEKYHNQQVSIAVLDKNLEAQKEESKKWKHLYEQRAKDEKTIIADFLSSDFYQDNFAIIQAYNFKEAQTKAVDICVEVDPSLNLQHEKIQAIYDPSAQEEYSELCALFSAGQDLRVHLGVIEDPNAALSNSGTGKDQETIAADTALAGTSYDADGANPTNVEKQIHLPET